MIQSLIAKIGTLGVVAILAAGVVVVGVGGGLVEHYRLTGQQESQGGEQSGSQTGSGANSTKEDQTGDQSKEDSNSASESRQGQQD